MVPVLRPLNLDDFIQSKAKVSSIQCVKYVLRVKYFTRVQVVIFDCSKRLAMQILHHNHLRPLILALKNNRKPTIKCTYNVPDMGACFVDVILCNSFIVKYFCYWEKCYNQSFLYSIGINRKESMDVYCILPQKCQINV